MSLQMMQEFFKPQDSFGKWSAQVKSELMVVQGKTLTLIIEHLYKIDPPRGRKQYTIISIDVGDMYLQTKELK